MHILSIFPRLLDYALVAPLFLRIAVSLFILFIGWERYLKHYKWISILYLISGILLFVGLYTQIALILGIIVVSFDFLLDKKISKPSIKLVMLYIMVKIILLSLLFTGPGFIAFDLPL